MEQTWHPTENLIPNAVDAAKRGVILTDLQLLTGLKHIVAMHHIRSFYIRRSAQTAADDAMSESLRRLTTSKAIREYMAQEFRNRHGRDAVDDSDLRTVLVEEAKSRVNWDPALSFRKKMEESFDDLKRILGRCHVEILRPPVGRHFVLGDTPAILIPPGGRKRDPHSDPLALFDAQFMLLPIHSDLCLRIPVSRDAFTSIGHREVDEINHLQIANAYRYVYFAPDSRTRRFVDGLAQSWRPRPEIPDLEAR